MIPKRIVLENFLSFGSPETEILFSDDEPLWVLGGPNGVGKSAVFDAMTYALYAEHRGGASDHASLIRHGANSFRVVFEFEFNGTTYQIARNRPLSGRPTQSIKQWADGRWAISVQLPPAAGRQDPIRLWAERTLGLGFDAFTASVLLRQGQADEIITATGSRRLAILKKIIAAERYEELSSRVHSATRACADRFESLRAERDSLTRDKGNAPSEAEILAASAALVQAEQHRTAANEKIGVCAERVIAARSWVALDSKCVGLKRQIAEADARAAAAEQIREQKARFDELTTVVPVLRQYFESRDRLAVIEPQFEAMRGTFDGVVAKRDKLEADLTQVRLKADGHRERAEHHDREVTRLRGEIKRDNALVAAAEAVATLQKDVDGFPSDFAKRFSEAQKQVKASAKPVVEAGQARAATAGLLKQTKNQQEKFATVGIGVKCSLCGQDVTEEHAERECTRLEAEVRQLQTQLDEAQVNESRAIEVKANAEAEFNRLDVQARNHAQVVERLTTKQQSLSELGITATADELRGMLSEKTKETQQQEKDRDAERIGRAAACEEVGRLDKEHQSAVNRLKSLTEQVHKAEQEIDRARGRQEGLVNQLTSPWREQSANLDHALVDRLDSEKVELERSGVIQRFRDLEQDIVRRGEWLKQLTEASAEIEATVPADARVPVVEAERAAQLAKQAAGEADRTRDTAKNHTDELLRLAESHWRLAAQIAIAEKQFDLHHRLDDLLGKSGLQRELVRTAERDIVRLANDTLQNLSDGDLTVELDDGADSDDEAFALRVRRADSPTPIGVTYLSGSQKFRVAISVALAIGRFAAGQARRLESVIIDEGFGSLDRDGLLAAATELNRLRQHLRRIILVSHQEEFADRFPVVIHLAQGENGTTATARRK